VDNPNIIGQEEVSAEQEASRTNIVFLATVCLLPRPPRVFFPSCRTSSCGDGAAHSCCCCRTTAGRMGSTTESAGNGLRPAGGEGKDAE